MSRCAEIVDEFSGARLKDERLTRRLTKVVEAVAASPSKGFPQVMSSDAELEGMYRLLRNQRVDWREILAPHFAASAERSRKAGAVVVAHDTTQFAFGGGSRADEVGHLAHGHTGFFGHFALGVSTGEERVPLGIVALQTFRRDVAEKKSGAKRRADDRATPLEEKESFRWASLAKEVADSLGQLPTVHVMDREADDYVLLTTLHQEGHRFVIRAAGNRVLLSDDGVTQKLKDALDSAEDVLFRDVKLEARTKKPGSARKLHPARDSRLAKLHVRATTVTFPRPRSRRECGSTLALTLNVVDVFEPTPPDGENAIRWTLMTTEPIDTPEARAYVVDCYRARWRIEEFFKSLKTGCAYEKRQLESEHALLNALALLTPMAWRLLLIRQLARSSPEADARLVFTADEIALLRVLSKRVKLTGAPTLQDALLAIAGIGGHLKNNGPPGWLTLGRGYQDFSMAYAGWLARSCAEM